MRVIIPGYSTISGRPKAILRLISEAKFLDIETQDRMAEEVLRELSDSNKIIIEEET